MDSPFVKYVVPTLGSVLGATMMLSPAKAVWQIRKTRVLGDINPLPYPLTAWNSIGWVVYGCLIHDAFIPPANILGLAAGFWFTLVAYPACDRKMQNIFDLLMVFSAFYFGLLGMVGVFGLDTAGQRRLWSISCILVLMLYYLVPLSTMYIIVKTRNAASIYLPLAFASIANGGLWTIYGLALNDITIWGPNAFGAVLACVQVGLRLLLGVKKGPGTMGVIGDAGDQPPSPGDLSLSSRTESRTGLLVLNADGSQGSGFHSIPVARTEGGPVGGHASENGHAAGGQRSRLAGSAGPLEHKALHAASSPVAAV